MNRPIGRSRRGELDLGADQGRGDGGINLARRPLAPDVLSPMFRVRVRGETLPADPAPRWQAPPITISDKGTRRHPRCAYCVIRDIGGAPNSFHNLLRNCPDYGDWRKILTLVG